MYCNGINLYRGGTESGNTQTYIGSYGSNQSNLSDNNFYIGGNGVNTVSINAGIGNIGIGGANITLSSNTVWIGSSSPAGNGRYTNINMLNSTGTGWETQSFAFTDSLKDQVSTSTTNIITILIQNSQKHLALVAQKVKLVLQPILIS
jgi:hypothetical protein